MIQTQDMTVPLCSRHHAWLCPSDPDTRRDYVLLIQEPDLTVLLCIRHQTLLHPYDPDTSRDCVLIVIQTPDVTVSY